MALALTSTCGKVSAIAVIGGIFVRRFLFAAALMLPAPTFAQDGPPGIAFVQAPEMSFGMAIGATPAEAFDAATAQCVDGGAMEEDCIPTDWCQPAGWSVDVFVQHVEGLHWHETVCGLASEDAALSVGVALCNPDDQPWITLCNLVQVWNPQGEPQL
jgi:hypothetical protein